MVVARVARVLAPGNPGGAQRREDRGLLQREEWPEMAPAAGRGLDRPGRREAARAAAARQPHEEGLGDVVLLVAEPEDARAPRAHRGRKKVEAGRAGASRARRPGRPRPGAR